MTVATHHCAACSGSVTQSPSGLWMHITFDGSTYHVARRGAPLEQRSS